MLKIIAFILSFISFVISLVMYPQLPDQLAILSSSGERGNDVDKAFGAYIMPALLLIAWLVHIVIEHIDIKKLQTAFSDC
ncbi:DUF1648 domain-containing protein [Parageobacillus thermoglucosidasius]|uniref:DUF1648 domain-containing protein n=1 Tax=Parageobacillus thermoglucosidasius TaxID=1426 RepID=UPI000E16E442|nr:DUF1648 domain-containing protein [Parageobacillus thermoglucosidasius]MED4904013.1 DUF1648 domain-containing protein [Parageobacillus thermoglucosidasius]MED4914958.1 DUF1648 domain-containing protein [Parageobacillus thermoglucosidasius]MED4943778.1 DUF1648 domain-containing protein [Parageobacillus thermoglucosidasius]MED4984214.1 DUF1648 domain-containing protein [Parageobacillus thermoglucosidasius]RDE18678.1 hypothetical protein DV714_20310 [Parageobacillus thermoglucosidasius]